MPSGMALAALLAQHHGGSGSGELVMTIMFVTVLSVIWIALGVLCWIFWRAKKREEAALNGSTASFAPHESERRG